MSLVSSCHCGRVRLTIPGRPPYLNECHCTVCYKYGTRWCYFPKDQVKIEISSPDDGTSVCTYTLSAPEAALSTPLPGLAVYMRTDLHDKAGINVTAFNRCAHCGGVTHWIATRPDLAAKPDTPVGINGQLFPEADLAGVERRVSQGP